MVRLEEDDWLNYSKFNIIVVEEFPKALRQTFKRMWNTKYGPVHQWDDSNHVRKLFSSKEGGKNSVKLMATKSYEKWDCTALCQATLYAKSFARLDGTGHLKTLNDLYIKPLGPNPLGNFHTSVISVNGNIDETFALAIDQLRLLRNWRSHSTSAEMDKRTFDHYVKLVRDAFKALSVKTDAIDAIVKAAGCAHVEGQTHRWTFFFLTNL